MSRFPVLLPLLLLATALSAGACSPVGVAVGAGATAGVAASEERGIEGTARDTAIRLEINDLWLKEGVDFHNSFELQIYEGRVLVTGRVPEQEMADKAIRLAQQPDGVRAVINETIVAADSFGEFTTDVVAANRLRTELTFTRDVHAINYSIRVVDGVVYLLGVAQDADELDRVINTARAMSGVRRVVSHVLTKDDPRRAGDVS
jgi:osmotically-inducible protein OsmY